MALERLIEPVPQSMLKGAKAAKRKTAARSGNRTQRLRLVLGEFISCFFPWDWGVPLPAPICATGVISNGDEANGFRSRVNLLCCPTTDSHFSNQIPAFSGSPPPSPVGAVTRLTTPPPLAEGDESLARSPASLPGCSSHARRSLPLIDLYHAAREFAEAPTGAFSEPLAAACHGPGAV